MSNSDPRLSAESESAFGKLRRQALASAEGIHLLQDSMSLRRRTAEIIRELVAVMPTDAQGAVGKPFAWVMPGSDTANDRGFIDAMAWEEGEFTKPLYASQPSPAPEPPADLGLCDRVKCGCSCREALAKEVERLTRARSAAAAKVEIAKGDALTVAVANGLLDAHPRLSAASEPIGYIRVWDEPEISPDFYQTRPTVEIPRTKVVSVYTAPPQAAPVTAGSVEQEIYETLTIAADVVCELKCPSVWKTGEKQPHTDECKKVHAARSAWIDHCSVQDLVASGGVFPDEGGPNG